MAPTAGQPVSSLTSSSHPRPSNSTTVALPPATLQPDPSVPFPIPYLPARIPLSPSPRSIEFNYTISRSSSPAISPTTIPTTTGPINLHPPARQFHTVTVSSANPAAASNPYDSYEDNSRNSACADPQTFTQGVDAVFPWTSVAWGTCNPADKTKSPVYFTSNDVSYTSGSSEEASNTPIRSDRNVFLEQWLREQAKFHVCDDFANQTDFVPFKQAYGDGCPGPRQMSPSHVPSAFPDRQCSERSTERRQSYEDDMHGGSAL